MRKQRNVEFAENESSKIDRFTVEFYFDSIEQEERPKLDVDFTAPSIVKHSFMYTGKQSEEGGLEDDRIQAKLPAFAGAE